MLSGEWSRRSGVVVDSSHDLCPWYPTPRSRHSSRGAAVDRSVSAGAIDRRKRGNIVGRDGMGWGIGGETQ